METNRIRYVDIDNSSYFQEVYTPVKGGVVLRAPRGTAEPMEIPKGNEDLIKFLFFKTPEAKYKDVLEAIEFNKNFSLFISAPAGTVTGVSNYWGGIYITTEGSAETFYQVTNPEVPNFLARLRVGNTSSVFSNGSLIAPYTLQTVPVQGIKDTYFEEAKVKHVIFSYTDEFGNEQTITCKLSSGNIVTDDTNEYVVGTYAPGAGNTIELIFTGNPALANFDLTASGALDTYFSTPEGYATIRVYWVYNIEEYVIQTLYQSSPTEIPLTFVIKSIDLNTTTSDGETNPYYNTMTFYYYEDGYTSPEFIISLDENVRDGFNGSLFYENVLPTISKFFIKTIPYKQYSDITGTYTFPVSVTITGTRSITRDTLTADDEEASLLEGWEAFNKADYEGINIFFDCTGYKDIITKMKSLRNGLFKTSTFIAPIKTSAQDTSAAIAEAIATRATLPNNRGGLAYYFNEFEIKLGNTYIWSNLMGSIADKLAQIIDKKLGGRAPMYLDDGDGLGGQLYRDVRRVKYNLESFVNELDVLDRTGINPVTKDKRYGIIIRSQRTAQSPSVVTDWSFLGHSMAFDLLKREIRDEVLIPQLGKAINSFYLELRQSQTENIVRKRLLGATAIWNNAIVLVNDPTVNNEETKKQNKFVVKVRIKVNPYAEYVELIIENVDQTTVL